MSITVAFDVYGTLIDTHGVIIALFELIGEKSRDFSQRRREKQLEYSFRRGLMQNYVNFDVCTAQALDYTCDLFKISLSDEQKQNLLRVYSVLPAYEDVREGLERSRAAGFRMYAFSNGSAEAVEGLLASAGIREFFLGVVSVDEMKSFKPNPGVYSFFLRKSGATGARAWLVSSNPFDVIGAISAGLRSAWVRRSPEAIFDPWGIEPTLVLGSLADLAGRIRAAENQA